MSKLESQLGQAIRLVNVVRTEASGKLGMERKRLAQVRGLLASLVQNY